EQNPDAKLEIKTSLFDYQAQENGQFVCFAGPPALKISGITWNQSPVGNYSCDPFPSPVSNLFEAAIAFSSNNFAPTRRVTIDPDGQLGIGNNLDPTEDLDVDGHIRMRTGAQAGYVAVSNNVGTMSWQSPSSLGIGGFWQAMTMSSPGSGHIMNLDNGEVHIGKKPYAMFFRPYCSELLYSNIVKEGDVGIFFGPTEEIPGELFQNEPGFVIAARNTANGNTNGLRMDWNGNVVIGENYSIKTSEPYKLAVNGNIIAELVKVRLRNSWPDYVFQRDYDLMSLPKLEEYINNNGHLPNVPSSTDVEKEGVDLGEMNRILLQKIEELTLYVIELEKRIK
ncbi:MAG: hypothetical protein KDC83_14030, partial [Flavobacteriales bacterium]|nr:hypothetical protein [Flavobacteriales bacterium]